MTEVLERAVRERPILFSGPMVHAILDGRKTQTRRVVKPGRNQPWLSQELLSRSPSAEFVPNLGAFRHPEGGPLTCIAPPYGVPGDLLWVRETCWIDRDPVSTGGERRAFFVGGHCRSSKGFQGQAPGHPDTHTPEIYDLNTCLRKTPSIHMPRWASRITLRITDVRVERLQDISEADALAEGCSSFGPTPGGDHNVPAGGAVEAYEHLWNHINGPGSWDANPWVWVVEFTPLQNAQPTEAARERSEHSTAVTLPGRTSK